MDNLAPKLNQKNNAKHKIRLIEADSPPLIITASSEVVNDSISEESTSSSNSITSSPSISSFDYLNKTKSMPFTSSTKSPSNSKFLYSPTRNLYLRTNNNNTSIDNDSNPHFIRIRSDSSTTDTLSIYSWDNEVELPKSSRSRAAVIIPKKRNSLTPKSRNSPYFSWDIKTTSYNKTPSSDSSKSSTPNALMNDKNDLCPTLHYTLYKKRLISPISNTNRMILSPQGNYILSPKNLIPRTPTSSFSEKQKLRRLSRSPNLSFKTIDYINDNDTESCKFINWICHENCPLFYESAYIAQADVAALFIVSGGIDLLIEYILKFEKERKKFHGIHNLITTINTIHTERLRVERAIFQHLTNKNCKLLPSNVTTLLTAKTIRSFLKRFNCKSDIIVHLWQLDAQQEYYTDLNELALAIHQKDTLLYKKRLQKTQYDYEKMFEKSMIISYMESSQCIYPAPNIKNIEDEKLLNKIIHNIGSAQFVRYVKEFKTSAEDLEIYKFYDIAQPILISHLDQLQKKFRKKK